jgi:poly(A) polymerase
MLQKIKTWLKQQPKQPDSVLALPKPTIIARKKHAVSRNDISISALKVMYRLRDKGYHAYLVGGGVRDLLLGRPPKDFDVVTNAKPEQIIALFRNGRIIGRRFLLVHIRFGREVIEVATFRAATLDMKKISQDGMVLRDNVYGSIEDDVCRRDFTINAIYYDINGFHLVDYYNGYKDLHDKKIRIIGDAATRYREDPLRMLRAIRFAGKLGFVLEQHTSEQIRVQASLLNNVAQARLFDEYIKLFLGGFSLDSFALLRQHSLFDQLFPQTTVELACDPEQQFLRFIEAALLNTDLRILEAKTVNPGFIIAVFLWEVLRKKYKMLNKGDEFKIVLYYEAIDIVLATQQKSLIIPKTFTFLVKEIWVLQTRLENRGGNKASRVFLSAKFRAGLDFLLLRAQAGDEVAIMLASWWQQYIHADEPTRFKMAHLVQKLKGKPKKHIHQKGKSV